MGATGSAVALGSSLWIAHGALMLVGLAVLASLGTAAQSGGVSSPAAAREQTSTVFLTYGIAIFLALLGSSIFGLAVLPAAESMAGKSAAKAMMTARLFFAHTVLTAAGGLAYVGVTLQLPVVIQPSPNPDWLEPPVIAMLAAWLIASLVLVPAMIRSRFAFSRVRPTPSSLPPLRMTLSTLYSIVNAMGVSLLFATVTLEAMTTSLLSLASDGNLRILYHPGVLSGAFMALLAAPTLAVAAFVHLLILVRRSRPSTIPT